MSRLSLSIFWVIILMQPCMSFAEGMAKEDKMAESYICITDESTGFKFNKSLDKWESVNFRVGQRFLISKEVDGKYAFKVQELGDSFPTSLCEDDFSEYGYLNCTDIMTFRMNKISLNFILVNNIGYVGPIQRDEQTEVIYDPKEYTPYMSIGKCSPL